MANTDTRYQRHRKILLGLGVIGLLAFITGLFLWPQRAWASLLLGNLYFLSLSLFGIVFVALVYVFSAGWAALFRRVPEAMSAYLPWGALVMAVITVPLFFGWSGLYPWAQPEIVASNPHLQHKAVYLNPLFFAIRAALAFGVWIFFARLILYHSRQQDRDGDLAHMRKNQTLSALFLVLFGVTFLFTSIDWIMSLEPEWYSTIFPIYHFAGLLLGGFAAMIVLIIQFQEKGLLSGISDSHLYELARALCASSLFWAYIWFSQYMLIYYTNIPEEAIYFARRLTGMGWFLSLLNLMLNWIIPQIVLIPARTRRSPQRLLAICAVVLLGRWLDLYLLIIPALGPPLGLILPIPVFLGFLPLFILPFVSYFRRAEPVPRQDPYLIESVHLHV